MYIYIYIYTQSPHQFWYQREVAERQAQCLPSYDELSNINGLSPIDEVGETPSASDGPTPTVFFLPDGHSLVPAHGGLACTPQEEPPDSIVNSSNEFSDIEDPALPPDRDALRGPPGIHRLEAAGTDYSDIEISASPPARSTRDSTLTSSSSSFSSSDPDPIQQSDLIDLEDPAHFDDREYLASGAAEVLTPSSTSDCSPSAPSESTPLPSANK